MPFPFPRPIMLETAARTSGTASLVAGMIASTSWSSGPIIPTASAAAILSSTSSLLNISKIRGTCTRSAVEPSVSKLSFRMPTASFLVLSHAASLAAVPRQLAKYFFTVSFRSEDASPAGAASSAFGKPASQSASRTIAGRALHITPCLMNVLLAGTRLFRQSIDRHFHNVDRFSNEPTLLLHSVPIALQILVAAIFSRALTPELAHFLVWRFFNLID